MLKIKPFICVVLTALMLFSIGSMPVLAEDTPVIAGDTTLQFSAISAAGVTLGRQKKSVDLTENGTTTATYETDVSHSTFTSKNAYDYMEFSVNVTKEGVYGIFLKTVLPSITAATNARQVYIYVDEVPANFTTTVTDAYGNYIANRPYGDLGELPYGDVYLTKGVHKVRIAVGLAAEFQMHTIRFERNLSINSEARLSEGYSFTNTVSDTEQNITKVTYKMEQDGHYFHSIYGTVAEGDYIQHAVTVPTTGYYDISVFGKTNRYNHIRMNVTLDDRENVIGVFNNSAVVHSGSVAMIKNLPVASNVYLTAGTHVLKFTAGEDTLATSSVSFGPFLMKMKPSAYATVSKSLQFSNSKNLLATSQTFEAEALAAEFDTLTGCLQNDSGYVFDKDGNHITVEGNRIFLIGTTADSIPGFVNFPISVEHAGNYRIYIDYSTTSDYTITDSYVGKNAGQTTAMSSGVQNNRMLLRTYVNNQPMAYSPAHNDKNGAKVNTPYTIDAGELFLASGRNDVKLQKVFYASHYRNAVTLVVDKIRIVPADTYAINVQGTDVSGTSSLFTVRNTIIENAAAAYYHAKFTPSSVPTMSADPHYIEYDIYAEEAGEYDISLVYAGFNSSAAQGGTYSASVNGTVVNSAMSLARRYKNIETATVGRATLVQGENKLRLTLVSGSGTGEATDDYSACIVSITAVPVAQKGDISAIGSNREIYSYAKLRNDTDDTVSAMVICCLYKMYNGGTSLVQSGISRIEIAADEEKTIVANVTIPDNGSYKVKAFLWDKMQTIVPLDMYQEIQ